MLKKAIKDISKPKLFFYLSLLAIIILLNYGWNRVFQKDATFQIYKSNCECRKDEKIILEENNDNTLSVFLVKNYMKTNLYNLNKTEYNELLLTCNKYSSLRRGKHQKVISYTLFGKNGLYYDKLKNVTKQIQRFYPDWLMRVYHDSSINTSIICDVECQTDEDGEQIDNSDFCDLSQFNVNLRGMNLTPVNYMLPRMWRFLAIGDSFIDIMMSRDSDSFILQREVDSVDVWLRSNKIAHAMRDHPGHGIFILAGMWGFKNVDNRDLARRIFYLSVDPDIMKVLNPNNIQPKRK